MGEKHCHNYTEEQKRFLHDNAPKCSVNELTELFNHTFATALHVGRIKGAIARYGVVTGRTGRFAKGQAAWNKGKRGIHLSPHSEFQKGHMPQTYRPVGSERLSKDGYPEVKVADPKTWKAKHRIIWEKAYGSIPRGHVVIFADGNPMNASLDNLMLVSRAELLVANRQKLIKQEAELTKTGIQVARVIAKTQELSRKRKKGKSPC